MKNKGKTSLGFVAAFAVALIATMLCAGAFAASVQVLGPDGSTLATYTLDSVANGLTVDGTSGLIVLHVTNGTPPPPPPPGTYSISGTVSGLPAGTAVTLGLSGTSSSAISTSGSYSFTGLSNGTYSVTPSSVPNYAVAPSSIPNITVNGANVSNQNFSYSSAASPNEVPILADYVYGSGDYIPTIPANTTVYLTCTIPAGETSSLLAVSSLYQNTDLNVFIVQGSAPLTTGAADNYYADFADVYNKYGWLAYPFHMPNTLAGFTFRTPAAAPPAWAKMSTSLGGESIILKEGTSVTDTTISSPLAGKYYIVIKNTGPKDNVVKINWKRY